MNDIILSLAPTGSWGIGHNNPVRPAELIKTAQECFAMGASVLHLHGRDLQGALTTDMDYLEETFTSISECTEMLLEASTGGLSSFTTEERGLPVTVPGAVMGSLNLGSLNFGNDIYQNSPTAVDFWIEKMDSSKVKPSLEVFDTGHLAFARSLIDQGKVTAPYNFSFIFNVKWGMVFSQKLLQYLISQLPSSSNWGVILVGSQDFSDHLRAAENGADMVRVGFEDSNIVNGKQAESNLEMVSALRQALEKHGFSILHGDPVRKKLLDN